MFKVVPDQLRISDGWVRCGQCGEIFDAAHSLLSDRAEEAPSTTASSRVSTQESALPVPLPGSAGASSGRSTPAAGAQPGVNPAQDSPDSSDAGPAILAREPTWIESARPAAASPAEAPALPVGNQPRVAGSPKLVSGPDTNASDVSFMRDDKKHSAWRRPIVRTFLLVLVLLLFAALAAQVLIHERDRIASIAPAARPMLVVLCSWTRCELSPLRQIESVVIDNSSFGRIRSDTYRLGISLRNNSAIDLAMPAIELSLTDAQDQAVVRRVILPSEFGATPALLNAGSDWTGSVTLGVKTAENAQRVAGYRVLAFYP